MTKAKDPAEKRKPGRKPGPLIPCGACFALMSSKEMKNHHAHCPDREKPKLVDALFAGWKLCEHENRYAIYGHQRIGPWRDTPLEAVRDCPRGKR